MQHHRSEGYLTLGCTDNGLGNVGVVKADDSSECMEGSVVGQEGFMKGEGVPWVGGLEHGIP